MMIIVGTRVEYVKSPFVLFWFSDGFVCDSAACACSYDDYRDSSEAPGRIVYGTDSEKKVVGKDLL